MSQKLSGVKGMNDLLPGEIEIWQRIEDNARDLFRRYGYSEVRTPIVEDTALFIRGVGDTTDIVGKEMYTFDDKAGRSLSLRPEGTAPAARAYIEHALWMKEPVTRWFYLGPMFRYERMKTGRYRQFYQIGVEAYGVAESGQDVEVMDMVIRLLRKLELQSVVLNVNSLGDQACRPAYVTALVAYFREHAAELCADCRERLDRNPLRILDCKNPGCQAIARGAPSVLEFLCQPCRDHFAEVQHKLKVLEIPFEVNPRMVRGLDYYTRTTFEFLAEHPALGTATAVGGGGRYDNLVQSLGGPAIPAVGFALGVDRLVLLLVESGKNFATQPDLFIVSADKAADDLIYRLARDLRSEGFWVEFDARGGSVKSQMKRADKSGARFSLVLGERELATRSAVIKSMAGGTSSEVPLDGIAAALR